jgi:hypothetical protein
MFPPADAQRSAGMVGRFVPVRLFDFNITVIWEFKAGIIDERRQSSPQRPLLCPLGATHFALAPPPSGGREMLPNSRT